MLDRLSKKSILGALNKLSTARRAQILGMLCEGMSMRAISRLADVSINTVTKLLIDAGLASARFHDEKVRGVRAKFVQCDGIWSFCYAKQKNVAKAKAGPDQAGGGVWTWTALDSGSKMILSYVVGGRDAEYALELMDDLCGRVTDRMQLTTDGHKPYLRVVEEAFGNDIDYAMLVKLYGPAPEGQRRDTRLTNAHSKKFENYCHMIALYTVFYNFVRINSAVEMAPAMAAGVSKTLWTMENIVELIDATGPRPGPQGPYKKRTQSLEA